MQRRRNGEFKFDADLYTSWRSRNGSSDSYNEEYHLDVQWWVAVQRAHGYGGGVKGVLRGAMGFLRTCQSSYTRCASRYYSNAFFKRLSMSISATTPWDST